MNSVTSQPPEPDRRRALVPLGNGKAGWAAQAFIGAALAALTAFAVAFWTASTQAEATRTATETQIRTGLAVIEERQKNQNEEVMRAIQSLREDLREVGRVRR